MPFTRQYEYVKEFKQAHRRDDDIAIVNAGMQVKLAEGPPGEAMARRRRVTALSATAIRDWLCIGGIDALLCLCVTVLWCVGLHGTVGAPISIGLLEIRGDLVLVTSKQLRCGRPHACRTGLWTIEGASIAYGGVAPMTLPAPATAAALIGKPLSQEALLAGLAAVQQDVQIDANAPGAPSRRRAGGMPLQLAWTASQLACSAASSAAYALHGSRAAVSPAALLWPLD